MGTVRHLAVPTGRDHACAQCFWGLAVWRSGCS